MIGREDKKANELFFICSLIDLIARKTKNKRILVVEKLGKEKIEKMHPWVMERVLLYERVLKV